LIEVESLRYFLGVVDASNAIHTPELVAETVLGMGIRAFEVARAKPSSTVSFLVFDPPKAVLLALHRSLGIGFDACALLVGLGESSLGLRDDFAIRKGRSLVLGALLVICHP